MTRQQVACAFCGQPTDIMPGTGHEGIDRLKRHYATIDGRRREWPGYRLSRATVQRIPALRERQAQRAGVARSHSAGYAATAADAVSTKDKLITPPQAIGEPMNYEQYVNTKRIVSSPSGFDTPYPMNNAMFDFQADIVRWALRAGKAAIFADCGMGKTLMELEWSRHIIEHTGQSVLVFAPLGVARQTVREGAKFGYDVNLCLDGADVKPGINITNYERLERFSPDPFAGIVLDESSILKGQFGKISKQLRDFADPIPYRLPASATPAPNDFEELIRHAEFLGIMTESEIKALFFTQEGNSSNKFRLKGHAIEHFWEWMASWAVAIRMPGDLGYDNGDFVLPPLHIHEHTVAVDAYHAGTLFAMEATTLQEQRQAAKASINDRVAKAAELVNAISEPWVVWCNLNDESAALTNAIPDAIEVKGSDSVEHKEDALFGFADGRYRVIVTKPSIAGFGMNWQHCANAAYVGLSHSYEQFYQSVRRIYRFGQTRPVHAHIITSTADGAVVQNIRRKEEQSVELFEQIVKRMAVYSDVHAIGRHEMEYNPQQSIQIPGWMKSYPNSEPAKREPGILLYDLESTVGLSVNGQLPTAMMSDGEPAQDMQLPSFLQEKQS